MFQAYWRQPGEGENTKENGFAPVGISRSTSRGGKLPDKFTDNQNVWGLVKQRNGKGGLDQVYGVPEELSSAGGNTNSGKQGWD